jgi:hypothetical protein
MARRKRRARVYVFQIPERERFTDTFQVAWQRSKDDPCMQSARIDTMVSDGLLRDDDGAPVADLAALDVPRSPTLGGIAGAMLVFGREVEQLKRAPMVAPILEVAFGPQMVEQAAQFYGPDLTACGKPIETCETCDRERCCVHSRAAQAGAIL